MVLNASLPDNNELFHVAMATIINLLHNITTNAWAESFTWCER